MDLRLIEAGLSVFQQKGVRFTMDDLSHAMGISKKTVYELVESKEALIAGIIGHVHEDIHRQQAAILADAGLRPAEKLERILTVLPVYGTFFEYGRLAELEEKYPVQFERMTVLLNQGWETTFDLYREGVAQGTLRPCHPDLFKTLYTSAVTALFHDRFVLRHQMPYADTLKEVVSILMHGFVQSGSANEGAPEA